MIAKSPFWSLLLWLNLLIITISAHASQTGIVTASKAIIYADQQMSAPVGYISRGKKIRVGDIPRNKAQVYPVIVAGKIAYIKVGDVSTELVSLDSQKLVAERFREKATKTQTKHFYTLSYMNYNAQINVKNEPGTIKNNDAVAFSGVNIRGGKLISPRWEFQLNLNYLRTGNAKERFSLVEFGPSFALRLIESKRFILKWVSDIWGIPWGNYELGNQFRINGYGFTVGSGLAANYRFGEHFGLSLGVSYHHSRIYGLDLPNPYEKIRPSFTGSRALAGISYYY
jgi:hypothetical protein